MFGNGDAAGSAPGERSVEHRPLQQQDGLGILSLDAVAGIVADLEPDDPLAADLEAAGALTRYPSTPKQPRGDVGEPQ